MRATTFSCTVRYGPFPSWDIPSECPAGFTAPDMRSKFGALAQLGERLICIQEVSGSIPLGSTIP